MFRAVWDILRTIGTALALLVTWPFRALARLFGKAARSGGRTGRRPARARRV
ncbi:LPFR motif small protein [Streptomyces longisporoflavus]|uniref:LPFR motif small protein n=1 Tax=Streptomyces longisporoflavus TaxID=28044 RepID=A0ABW7QWQ6_9ACTN